MRCRNRDQRWAYSSMRRGGSVLPVVVACACIAIVLVAVLVLSGSRSEPQQVAAQPEVKTPAPAVVEKPSVPVVAASKNVEASAPVAESKPGAEAVELSGEELVRAHLAAGEFGPALAVAHAATIPAERSALLMLVADAQMQSGEFDAALFAIRGIPDGEARVAAQDERAEQRSLAGGSGADFDRIIDLIMTNTEAQWEEEDGEGGTISQDETGVRVDPNGMLVRLTQEEHDGRLKSLGIAARQADINDDMAQPSALRLVSLTRLEREISKRIAEGKPVVETMRQLAGLSAIQYVFVYPESGEVVIGGPAEGWKYDDRGMPVGVSSGRPTLQLDDLVTVMRTFSSDGMGIFNCLIVPRQEGLKAVKEYVEASNAKGPLTSTRVHGWVKELQQRLGQQDIEVNGVPNHSRVARVIVEADYRMKLIGVGKLDGGQGIPSYFDLLGQNPQSAPPALDALRWWLTMNYDAVLHSPEKDVFEIQGSSVACLSDNEIINDAGERIHTGKTDPINAAFAQNFTQHYAELADRDIVFAELQNIFDLSLVAALLRHEGLADRAKWDLGAFAAHGAYHPARFAPASTVMTVANHRVYNGKDIVAQAAGGVRGDLLAVVRDADVVKESPRLKDFSNTAKAPELPEGRWWWDAAK